MGVDVRVIEVSRVPKELVELTLARIQLWVAGEDVQLSNLSAYMDLSVAELVSDRHKAVLQGIRQEIMQPPQAGWY